MYQKSAKTDTSKLCIHIYFRLCCPYVYVYQQVSEPRRYRTPFRLRVRCGIRKMAVALCTENPWHIQHALSDRNLVGSVFGRFRRHHCSGHADQAPIHSDHRISTTCIISGCHRNLYIHVFCRRLFFRAAACLSGCLFYGQIPLWLFSRYSSSDPVFGNISELLLRDVGFAAGSLGSAHYRVQRDGKIYYAQGREMPRLTGRRVVFLFYYRKIDDTRYRACRLYGDLRHGQYRIVEAAKAAP